MDFNEDDELDQPSDLEGDEAPPDLNDGKPRKVKKFKKGIIYVSNLPKHMNVTRIRETLGVYGDLGRVFLQPDKLPGKFICG